MISCKGELRNGTNYAKLAYLLPIFGNSGLQKRMALVARDKIYLPAEDRLAIVSRIWDKGCKIRTSKMPEHEGKT